MLGIFPSSLFFFFFYPPSRNKKEREPQKWKEVEKGREPSVRLPASHMLLPSPKYKRASGKLMCALVVCVHHGQTKLSEPRHRPQHRWQGAAHAHGLCAAPRPRRTPVAGRNLLLAAKGLAGLTIILILVSVSMKEREQRALAHVHLPARRREEGQPRKLPAPLSAGSETSCGPRPGAKQRDGAD